MFRILAVIAGGGLGALSRFLVSGWLNTLSGSKFPLGTLGVNVLGSFIMGFLYRFFEGNVRISQEWKGMILVGFLGAFTTFSSYSIESLNLLRNGSYGPAFLNFFLNNLLCLAAVAAGFWLAGRR